MVLLFRGPKRRPGQRTGRLDASASRVAVDIRRVIFRADRPPSSPTKSGPTVTMQPLPSRSSAPPVHGLAFDWPGDDCWNIFRGADLVTFQCGAKQQALGPGTYTLKGRHAPLFLPLDVEVKAGAETRVALGGVIDFRWPGDDCWDMFRGEEPVTFQCGAKRQALGPGSYTIKGRHAPVFLPFLVEIKSGSTTRERRVGCLPITGRATTAGTFCVETRLSSFSAARRSRRLVPGRRRSEAGTHRFSSRFRSR